MGTVTSTERRFTVPSLEDFADRSPISPSGIVLRGGLGAMRSHFFEIAHESPSPKPVHGDNIHWMGLKRTNNRTTECGAQKPEQ